MVFSSIIFLFVFLPLFLAGYFLLNPRFRNVFLLLASLLFYYWGEPSFLLIMLASILWNYVTGLGCAAAFRRNRSAGWLVLLTAVAGNLALLFYFKYFDFAVTTVNHLFSMNLPARDIALPIGISFFTFQGMSYVIDVARGKVAPQKNPLTMGLYISMFPQLIAGPIVRYSDIEREIQERSVTAEDFYGGISRFTEGLCKKVLIANSLALPVDQIFALEPSQIGVSSAWIGALFYTLQIYFDFSGYSDMAIGLGRMMGFHFLENFNYPYLSKSMTEFWRRWHISLSTWFRDYVYIPLGGNRRGNVYLHLILVFFLTGLWHGASWNFVVWGLWHGAFLLAERLERKHGLHHRSGMVSSVICQVYTLLAVVAGWVFFRADTLGYAVSYLKVMFGLGQYGQALFGVSHFITPFTTFMLATGILFSTDLPARLGRWITERSRNSPVVSGILHPTLLLFLLLICGVFVMASTYNPFIYFRF